MFWAIFRDNKTLSGPPALTVRIPPGQTGSKKNA